MIKWKYTRGHIIHSCMTHVAEHFSVVNLVDCKINKPVARNLGSPNRVTRMLIFCLLLAADQVECMTKCACLQVGITIHVRYSGNFTYLYDNVLPRILGVVFRGLKTVLTDAKITVTTRIFFLVWFSCFLMLKKLFVVNFTLCQYFLGNILHNTVVGLYLHCRI